jgi:NADH dehydrogenase FAD-containing subunit
MPWKEVGTTAQTRASLAKLQAGIRDAQSIIVSGAGVTGVEFAGELGSAYGKTKEISLLGSDALPLPSTVKTSVREAARRELEALGVKYIGRAKITLMNDDEERNIKKAARRTIALAFADDGRTATSQTLTADLAVPTFGILPNTEFAPAGMRDADSKLLKQDADLRAPGHANVFVLGDAGDLQPAQAAYTDAQARHLMTQFDAYFADEQIKPYVFDVGKTQIALTTGRDRGTGQVGSWQPWSILIWYLKGRHLGTDHSASYARGESGSMGRSWPK